MSVQGDLGEFVALLADLLEAGQSIPLTDQRRVDAYRVRELADMIARAAEGQEARRVATLVREEVSNARPVPLTDQVRVPGERLDELAAALRALDR